MKSVFWLIVGIVGGFAVAHQINNTQRGGAFFADLDDKLREFGDSIADAYKEREAELRASLESVTREAEDAIDKLSKD
ncbi:hypothetical protein ELQ90_06275 [Labedella phragmitis]|jgi:hypothetical protein|uniref:Uncharacterized protein n=1 Tax=Labedella phragmitis TaxID=2498849 RepID=A0A3S4DHA3_9MICO|nr:hypothetical protein [Labedella phragmitis]RWZ51700.1 hypothetical protein ELQ90_06275 [Labedella phragmitis]